MRAAAVRLGGFPVAAGAVASFALFFSHGFDDAALVWIGGLALLLGAIGVATAPRLDAPTSAFLAALFGLAVWIGVSTIWSISPERTWTYTNRTLVYVGFALVGVLLATFLSRPAPTVASAAAVLLGLLGGWALLTKFVPALYPDYGRVARLRAPVGYWNELALLAVVAVPIALWVAAPSSRTPAVRAAGVLLLFVAGLTVLLTYSRFGAALAVLAAAGWILLERDRVESLAATALAAAAAGAAFGVALALPGITSDGQSHATRVRDGWIFALVVVAAAAVAFACAFALARLERSRPLPSDARARGERAAAIAGGAAVLAAVVLAAVFAGRLWHSFSNPVSSQIRSSPGRLQSLNSSNRWRWWTEEWHVFTRHPAGGTGAGTFQISDQMLRSGPLTTEEPHNVPLQLLGETGVPGFLLFAAAVVAAAVGVVLTRRRADGADRPAVTALAIGLAAFALHLVVDMDWNFVATCGPLLLIAGALVGRPAPGRAVRGRRPLLSVGAVLVALAAVYSLAAPWLAERELSSATTIAQVKRAHTYDPLSTEVLSEWATFEDASGHVLRAAKLYRDEVALEPQTSAVWWDLGSFYWEHGDWARAYQALSRSWTYDRYGPAGTPCGLLDQARHKALGVWPASCPGGRPVATS